MVHPGLNHAHPLLLGSVLWAFARTRLLRLTGLLHWVHDGFWNWSGICLGFYLLYYKRNNLQYLVISIADNIDEETS